MSTVLKESLLQEDVLLAVRIGGGLAFSSLALLAVG